MLGGHLSPLGRRLGLADVGIEDGNGDGEDKMELYCSFDSGTA